MYTLKKMGDMAKDLNESDKESFANTLYETKKKEMEARNKDRRKKGEPEIPFTKENIFDCMFNGSNILSGQYELVKGGIEIMLKHKGITERAAIEKFVSNLYDEKGRNYVKDAFFANYDIKEEDWHTDIRFMDATPYKGQVDLYVGGSPCCSFSKAGKRLCMEDTRGELIYDFALRIKECEPKVFIFENVSDIIKPQKEGYWSGLEVALTLFDELGYKLYWNVMDGRNYGVPQHRERVWVVGFKDDVDFKFPNSIPLNLCMYDLLDVDILPRSGEVYKIDERELT